MLILENNLYRAKKIPKCKIISYKELAIKLSKPKAYLTVANAYTKNPLLEIIPCHRVIRCDSRIGRFISKERVERKVYLKVKAKNFRNAFMIQKLLIIIGVLFIIAGLLYPFLKDIGLGRLPGDIVIKKENSSFYFPIVTCIIVSVLISLILMFFKK